MDSELEPEENYSRYFGMVQLAALKVYVVKLLEAQQPEAMPPDFAEALTMLKLLVEQG